MKRYDSVNMTTSLVDGLPLVHTWDGAAKLAISQLGEDACTYVLPAEGFTMWVDNLAIPKDAPNPYAAHLFINFACEPRIAAELVAFTKYQTPNAAVVPMLSRFQRRWTRLEPNWLGARSSTISDRSRRHTTRRGRNSARASSRASLRRCVAERDLLKSDEV